MTFNPFTAITSKIYAAMFAGALTLAAVQSIRIEGFWFIPGLEDKLTQTRNALAAEKDGRNTDRANWAKQVAAAQAATAAAEHASKEIAIDAEASHNALLADNAGLRDYIAGHRLRDAGGTVAAAAGAAGADSAGLSSSGAAGAFVATTEADLVTCDADYSYAAGAHAWAEQLIASGLAK